MNISHVAFSKGILAMIAIGAMAGCGDPTVVCVFATNTGDGVIQCLAETPDSADTSEDIQETCSAKGGTLLRSCPTANIIGRCKATRDGLTVETISYYPDPPIPIEFLEALETSCKAEKGTWIAKE